MYKYKVHYLIWGAPKQKKNSISKIQIFLFPHETPRSALRSQLAKNHGIDEELIEITKIDLTRSS